MSNIPIIKYLIRRVGQPKDASPESIPADSVEMTDADPKEYVFRREGSEERRIFVHALEVAPEPVHAVPLEEQIRMQQLHGRFAADKLGYVGNL
jgi:hypothetical protein